MFEHEFDPAEVENLVYPISCDVTDDNSRGRAVETPKDFGRRAQYSVFKGNRDEKAPGKPVERPDFEIDGATDPFRTCFVPDPRRL